MYAIRSYYVFLFLCLLLVANNGVAAEPPMGRVIVVAVVDPQVGVAVATGDRGAAQALLDRQPHTAGIGAQAGVIVAKHAIGTVQGIP